MIKTRSVGRARERTGRYAGEGRETRDSEAGGNELTFENGDEGIARRQRKGYGQGTQQCVEIGRAARGGGRTRVQGGSTLRARLAARAGASDSPACQDACSRCSDTPRKCARTALARQGAPPRYGTLKTGPDAQCHGASQARMPRAPL
eukprot:6174954-Pleurochrysis_carterae.AAC.1